MQASVTGRATVQMEGVALIALLWNSGASSAVLDSLQPSKMAEVHQLSTLASSYHHS